MNPDVTRRYTSPAWTKGPRRAGRVVSRLAPSPVRLPPGDIDVSRNTAAFRPTMVFVTTGPAPAARCRIRWAAGGRAARTHSKQWEPTVASRRQSGQAGPPQRVEARPVGRSRGWKQVAASPTRDSTARETGIRPVPTPMGPDFP